VIQDKNCIGAELWKGAWGTMGEYVNNTAVAMNNLSMAIRVFSITSFAGGRG
jgi:hypothetical protein